MKRAIVAVVAFALLASAPQAGAATVAPAPVFNVPGGLRSVDLNLSGKTNTALQFLVLNPDTNNQAWALYTATAQVQAGSPPIDASSSLGIGTSFPLYPISAGATALVTGGLFPKLAGVYTVTFTVQFWDGQNAASVGPAATTAFIVNVLDTTADTSNLSATAVVPHYNLNLNAVINGSLSVNGGSAVALAPSAPAAQTAGAMVVVTFMNRGGGGLTFTAGQTGVSVDAHQSTAMIMDVGSISAGGIEVFSENTGFAGAYTILISAGPSAAAAGTAPTQPTNQLYTTPTP